MGTRLAPSPADSQRGGPDGHGDPSGVRSLPARLAPFLFWRRRLVFRLVASFLIVSLAVLALTGYFATSRARDSLENEVVQRLEAAGTA